MSNSTSNQVGQTWTPWSKWLMVFSQLGHYSSWTNQNDILSQDGQWCSSQMGHLMLLTWSR
jgi:hypothetical protein